MAAITAAPTSTVNHWRQAIPQIRRRAALAIAAIRARIGRNALQAELAGAVSST
jgi:hypothetical protein